MSVVTKYVLKTAYDERKHYQTQVQQNWLGQLQAVVLLATAPLLIRHAHEFAPNGLMALNASREMLDYPSTFALLYTFIALVLFALQMVPPFLLRQKEKDLGTVAKSFSTTNRANLEFAANQSPYYSLPKCRNSF